jgi:uncharacterized protein DUF4136
MKGTQRIACVVAAAVMLAIMPVAARVDVKVEFDKAFDFKGVKTWGWNPRAPGEVKMARTQQDDPESARRRAEPIIVDAVTAAIGKKGLQQTTAEPDLTVTYYLLLTTSMSAQTVGQFLPATTGWGLPPFEQATQSLKMMNRGSLVLDLTGKGNVVWRGLAQANIKFDADESKRESLLREAVRDLLAKYPPRG